MKANSVAALLAEARRSLKGETAAIDARLLLQGAAGLTHIDIISDPNGVLSAAQLELFNSHIARRLAHEPVSRILGQREFYGRVFKVTPAVLDPRADTECVVELALHMVKQGRFIDLGTGSGAIAITLCAENGALTGLASDISPEALGIAQSNAEALGVSGQLTFQQGNWFEGLSDHFELIISNPPYIREDASLAPDVMNFDPHVALFGGADGLAAYRAIAAQCRAHLAEKGTVVVEIGHEQVDAVVEIFAAKDFMLTAKAVDIAGYIRGLAFQVKK